MDKIGKNIVFGYRIQICLSQNCLRVVQKVFIEMTTSMFFLGAQEALKKKHKLRKYTPHDFKDYINFEKDLAQRKAQFAELESSADPEQLKLLKECFEKIDESAEKWLDGLDQGLPKQLAKVGKFLKDAKQELKYATEEADDSRMRNKFILNSNSYII